MGEMSSQKINPTQKETLIGDFFIVFQEIQSELTLFFEKRKDFLEKNHISLNSEEIASQILYRIIFFHQFESNTGNSIVYEPIYPLLGHSSDHPNIIQKIIKIYEIFPQNIIDAACLAHDNAVLQNREVSDLLTDSNFPHKSLERFIDYLHKTLIDISNVDLFGLVHQAGKQINQRKLMGQFYTPGIIREFIIQSLPWNSFLSATKRNEIITFIDPACGTGGFLINLYHKISHIRKSQRNANLNSNQDEKFISRYALVGVDTDEKAIQLAKFNLLSRHNSNSIFELPQLKVLDAVRQIIHRDNIFPYGKRHKCMLVVGNPPFFEIKKFEGFEDAYPELAEVRKPNIASLFLIRYSQWLAPKGILAFVFPASLLFSMTFLKTRQFILCRYRILRIVQLGKIFSQVGLEQIILIIQNLPPSGDHLIDVVHGIQSAQDLSNTDLSRRTYLHTTVKQAMFLQDPHFKFTIYRSPVIDAMLMRIHEKCKPLKEYVETYSSQSRLCIFRGLGLEKWSQSQTSPHSQLSPDSIIPGSKIPSSSAIILKGNDLKRYGTKSAHLIDKKYLKSATPKMHAMILREKIILQRLVSSRTRIVATLVGKDVISLSTIENIILKPQYSSASKSEAYRDFIYYILALLNSDFMTYFIIDHVFIRCKLSTSLDRQYLENLPVWLPSPSIISSISSLTRKMLSLVTKLSSSASNNDKIENIEKNPVYLALNLRINDEIASIYNLSNDEQTLIHSRIQEFYR